LSGYVTGISDDDLSRYLTRAQEAARIAEAEVGIPKRRGDLTVIRTPARWPWRVTTGGVL
jgi:hypothetical protein